MIKSNFLAIMMHYRFMGHQSYVLKVMKLLLLTTQSYFLKQDATSIYSEVRGSGERPMQESNARIRSREIAL